MLVTADLHTHSAYSFDADYDPAQMLAAAAENGLRQICITDHVDFYTPSDVHLPDLPPGAPVWPSSGDSSPS